MFIVCTLLCLNVWIDDNISTSLYCPNGRKLKSCLIVKIHPSHGLVSICNSFHYFQYVIKTYVSTWVCIKQYSTTRWSQGRMMRRQNKNTTLQNTITNWTFQNISKLKLQSARISYMECQGMAKKILEAHSCCHDMLRASRRIFQMVLKNLVL